MLRKQLAAEFIGTFFLVFAGAGAVVVDRITGGALGHLGIAAAFGLVVMVAVYSIGHISGAHINPAVTLAFAVGRHFAPRRLAGYWLAQLAGAVAAAGLLRAMFGRDAAAGVTLPRGSALESLVMEIFLTFWLMFVITAMATDVRAVGEAAAIAIGGTILLDSLFGGLISGASMNPARSFGPALVSGRLADNWIYWVGPALGAVLGVLAYEYLRESKT